MNRVQLVEQEAERMATREYLARGKFGGESKASGGVIVSKKFFDFEDAKRRAIVYLQKIGYGIQKSSKKESK